MTELDDAAAAVTRSRTMEEAVRRRSGWYLRYLSVYGVAQAVLVLTALLWHNPVAVGVGTALWALCIAGLSLYAARQSAVRRRFGLRHGLIIGSWSLLYVGALALGPQVAPGSVPIAVGVRLEVRDGATA